MVEFVQLGVEIYLNFEILTRDLKGFSLFRFCR